MMRLIEEIVRNLKGHPKLPSTVQSIEAFVSQPVIGNNSTEEECGEDAAILERLKQYLDAIVKSYIVVTEERKGLSKLVDLMKEQINGTMDSPLIESTLSVCIVFPFQFYNKKKSSANVSLISFKILGMRRKRSHRSKPRRKKHQ